MLGARLKIFGCEASLESYKNSGLFDELSQLHKDALSLYIDLKYDCDLYKHTFIDESELRSYNACALEFLVEQKLIVKLETCGSSRRVYLYELWKAERDIANGVQEVFTKHPWSLGVDFER